MGNKVYDYLIVGAGCAGLSLAYHLAQRVELDNCYEQNNSARFEQDNSARKRALKICISKSKSF